MPFFHTHFATPNAVTLSGVADPEASTITLAIGATADPFFEDFRIWWQDDSNEFVQVGQQTGTSFVHFGARLGTNTYRVTVWNGALESDPVELDVDLTGIVAGAGMVLREGSDRLRAPLLLDDMGFQRLQVRVMVQPLDARRPVELRGVAAGRSGTMRVTIPADSREWLELYEALAEEDEPSVIKDVQGRVFRVSLGMPQITYSGSGFDQATMGWVEVA